MLGNRPVDDTGANASVVLRPVAGPAVVTYNFVGRIQCFVGNKYDGSFDPSFPARPLDDLASSDRLPVRAQSNRAPIC